MDLLGTDRLSTPPVPPPKDKGDASTVTEPSSMSMSRSSGSSSSRSRRSHSDLRSKTAHDLAYIRSLEERKELQKLVLNLNEQLKNQVQRADEAEKRVTETTTLLKTIIDDKVAAQHDAAKANEELRLYKIQLQKAQTEIFRAQDVFNLVNNKRHDAEKEAAHYRSSARRLREQRLIDLAREEGRQQGLREGLQAGGALGMDQRHMMTYPQTHREPRPRPAIRDSFEDEDYTVNEEPDEAQSMTTTSPSEESVDSDGYVSIPPTEDQRIRDAPPARVHSTPVQQSERNSIHPTIVHNQVPTPHHAPIHVPPEGYIPSSDYDDYIRLPPPHELSNPVPATSPQAPLPPLPAVAEEPPMEDSPLVIPPPTSQTPRSVPYGHHGRRRRSQRESSPDSSSTRLSEMDLVNDPGPPARSPLSVIPEVRSTTTSPMAGLSHKPSITLTPSSIGRRPSQKSTATPGSIAAALLNPDPNAHITGPYTRPQSSSSSSLTSHTPSGFGSQHRASYATEGSSIPEITIKPPSRPTSISPSAGPSNDLEIETLSPNSARRTTPLPASFTAPGPSGANIANFDPSKPMPLMSEQLPPGFVPAGPSSRTSTPFIPPFASAEQSTGPLPIPGAYQDVGPGPVIPDPKLFDDSPLTDSDSSTPSSGLSSGAHTLTTPPPMSSRSKKKKRASLASAASTARTTPLGGPLYPSESPTLSKKGVSTSRPASRATNKSGRTNRS